MDFTTALGRLLTDPQVRDEFRQSPDQVADRLELSLAERECFVRLDIDAIDRQSQALVDKRFHEVHKLAPQTMQSLADQAKPLFDYFATQFWPTGHHRHTADALEFLKFLESNQLHRCHRQELIRLKKMV